MTKMGQKKGTKRSLMNAMRNGLSGLRTLIAGSAQRLGSSVSNQGGQVGSSVLSASLRLKQPIWMGRLRPRNHGGVPSPAGSCRPDDKKGNKRQRDRQMRQGLPSMSGRQWRRIRKAMYRKAKFLTIQQRQEAGR